MALSETQVTDAISRLTDGQRRVLASAEASADGKVRVPVVLGNLNIITGWPFKFIDPDPRSPFAALTELGLAARAAILKATATS